MRIRDWYFQGWERRKDESGKTVFVYTGEYYSFSGGTGTVKKPCALLAAALIVLYLVTALFPSPGGMWHYAAIPQLIEIIPLIYLAMGTVCLLRAGDRLTFRDHHAAWRRVEYASVGSAVFTVLMVAAELAFLFTAEDKSLPRELLYLLCEIGCAALSIALIRFVRSHPCIQTINNEKE